jgi:FkbM family methyltransferase
MALGVSPTMNTLLLRRAVPKSMRRLYRQRFPRKQSRRLDKASQLRHFQLDLPRPPGALLRRPRMLSLTTPAYLSVPRGLFLNGLAGYEPEALSTVLAILQGSGKSGLFFDIGSNVGPFCFLAAALTRSTVVAFEPTPQTAAVARRIRDDNGLRYMIEELAFGETKGISQLYLSTASDASNSLRVDFRPWEDSIPVEVETLDGYCARTGLTPTVLKIDTEATEPAVLRGSHRLLSEQRPWIVCEVLAGRTESDLEDILRSHDYRFYEIGEAGVLQERTEIHGDLTYRYRDWLFAPGPLPPETARLVRKWHRAFMACRPR